MENEEFRILNRLQTFTRTFPIAAAMLDRNMHYMAVSDRWLETFHLVGQILMGRSHYDIFPETSDDWKALYNRSMAGGHEIREGNRIDREDGSTQWLRWEVVPWLDEEESETGGIIISVEDITERKKTEDALKRSETRFRQLLEFAPDGIVVVNEQHEIIMVNGRTRQLTGYSSEELIQQPIEKLVPDEISVVHVGWRNEFVQGLRPNAHKRGESSELFCRRRDGSTFPADISVSPLAGDEGPMVFAIIRDITERKKLEEILRKLSITDGLTGLANRRAFDEAIELEWRRAVRAGTPIALIMIDIDNFKKLNDTYGHPAGDECLRIIGKVLKNMIRRAGDLAARYGGDEFVLLLPATNVSESQKIAEEIRSTLAMTKILPGGRDTGFFARLSIGISAVVPNQGASAEGLLAIADQALYRAKQSGKNRIAS